VRRLLLTALLLSAATARAGDLGLSVAASGRAYFIPTAFFANVFDNWTNQPNWGTGLTLGLTGLTVFDPEVVVEVGSLVLPEGNFRQKDTATWRTVRADIDLVSVTAAARLRFDWVVWRRLHLGLAVGGGVIRWFGTAVTREVLPGCKEPVDQCGAWDTVGTHDVRALKAPQPVIIAAGHVAWEVWPGWQAVLEGGLQDFPFVGLSVRYNLTPNPLSP
jgi:hypothetical protein